MSESQGKGGAQKDGAEDRNRDVGAQASTTPIVPFSIEVGGEVVGFGLSSPWFMDNRGSPEVSRQIR